MLHRHAGRIKHLLQLWDVEPEDGDTEGKQNSGEEE